MASSGDVSFDLAQSGAVGTWLGTGSLDLPHKGGPIMTIRIEDDFMTLEVDGGDVATAPVQPACRGGRQRACGSALPTPFDAIKASHSLKRWNMQALTVWQLPGSLVPVLSGNSFYLPGLCKSTKAIFDCAFRGNPRELSRYAIRDLAMFA